MNIIFELDQIVRISHPIQNYINRMLIATAVFDSRNQSVNQLQLDPSTCKTQLVLD